MSGWMPIFAQFLDAVLRGLGLDFARGAEVGHQRDVQKEAVLRTVFKRDLADGFKERQAFDVADGAADFDDLHVVVILVGHHADAVLDLARDVRDDLHRGAEEVALALLGDHAVVDLAGGGVVQAAHVFVDEALVVAEIEIGFRAVLGDVHLAVLVGIHRPGIDVDVGVELHHRDAQAARLQQPAERGRRDALAQRRDDAARDKDVFRLFMTGVLRPLRHDYNLD